MYHSPFIFNPGRTCTDRLVLVLIPNKGAYYLHFRSEADSHADLIFFDSIFSPFFLWVYVRFWPSNRGNQPYASRNESRGLRGVSSSKIRSFANGA